MENLTSEMLNEQCNQNFKNLRNLLRDYLEFV